MRAGLAGAVGLGLLVPAGTLGQTPPGPMARARYSLPWNLRPAIAPNLLRVDHAMAFVGASAVGTSPTPAPPTLDTVTLFTGGGRPFPSLPQLGFYTRLGFVTRSVEGSDTRAAFVNPALFALWTPQVATGLRVPVFLGFTVPVGPGSDASAAQRATFASGVYARQAMDNALFAGNYFTVMGGAGLMWMGHGLTAQAEFTVLQLTRVWGESVDADVSRSNLTVGAHLAWQVIPWLTASLEAHYQHWLSTPRAVSTQALFRSQFTFGGGVRGNFPWGTALLRPGVAFFMPIGGPMGTMDYRILQFDFAVPLG